jgi:hypothetical protein
MKALYAVFCLFSMLFLAPSTAVSGDQNTLWIGYGFGLFNEDGKIGRIEGSYHDYVQVTYGRELPLRERLCLVLEPSLTYVNLPTEGIEPAFTINLKYKSQTKSRSHLYVTGGIGAAYTSLEYQGQGSHLLFILQAGIGLRFERFFIETRLKHYSNGNTEFPNRSINSNTLLVGTSF